MQASIDISYTDITEVYLQELRRGNRVSVHALAKQFPQFSNRILTELPMMAALESDLGGKSLPLPKIPNYQLIEEIGNGASGVVYKAKHHSGRFVAIKLVRLDREFSNLGRLDREIESLSRLIHPHIVKIESFGTSEDYVYIVTNLVEGLTLAEILSPRPTVPARYWLSELHNDWNLLATWGLEIASALEYIHQNKIIHRDIKPSNLLIDKSGKCCIVDFGLAKVNELGMTVSQSKQIAGTPRFMAPEQLRGVVDPRCDVYSLGRTLYELASHGSSDNSSPVETPLVSQVNPNIAKELASIIDRACEPHPERRIQSAKEMAAVLARFLEGKTPCDRRRVGKRMTEQEFKTAMRNRVRYAIAGGILCFLAVPTLIVAPRLFARPVHNPMSVIKPQEQNNSLKKLASAIENEDSGFVEVIGEAIKHSVVSQSNNQASADEVTAKIDRIVEKVTTEGLKPGELDSLIKNYRNSPIMNANKVSALHHPLHNSTLSAGEKLRGHTTLELFAKAIVNKRVPQEKADRVLASLFQGEIPRLEQIVSLKIPDQTLVSWLRLVESSFSQEFQMTMAEGSQSNQELKNIIDNFLHQSK
jgi:serine/threonine protein kinase